MCAAKLLSFAWAPLGAGFASCYRSLYQPLADISACEKSFESPFSHSSGTQYANSSRMDGVVDFGIAPFDWNLPFMNDFPRLRYLWLDRFPFTAKFAARINDVESGSLLPIFGIGKLSVKVDNEMVGQAEDYAREFVTAIPLRDGSNELIVDYEYRDDYVSEPESAPEPRGPYARLKVGEPMTMTQLAEITRVRVNGGSIGLQPSWISKLEIRDRNGELVRFTDTNLQRTSSGTERDPLLRPFDIEIEIPALSLLDAPLSLQVNDASSNLALATIASLPGTLSPQLNQSSESRSLLALTATLTADRDSFKALKPGVRDIATPPLKILIFTLDILSFTVLVALAWVILATLRSETIRVAMLALLGWFAVGPFYSALPTFLGGGRELVVPYAIIAVVGLVYRERIQRFPLPYLMPLAWVLSAQKTFEHVRFNHLGHGDQWWGQLIYQWRDSDWFTNHGLSRAILMGDIFRAGESVFYVRAAPRYLLYLSHLALGENDILIGLLSLGVGFVTVLALAVRFAVINNSRFTTLISVSVAYIGMIFLGDQTITAFGFLVTSEYSSWVLLLSVSYYLLDRTREYRVWVTVSLAAVLAILVQFRPNLVFSSLAILVVLLLTRSARDNRELLIRQVAGAVAAYAVVLSLSLIHNLFYGARFVVFTSQVFSDWVRFNWIDIWGEEGWWGGLSTVWSQIRALLYWQSPGDASYAIIFWGSQILLVVALLLRWRGGRSRSAISLVAVLPLTYVLPMLNFNFSSYFPRHLVAASLLCLCSALLIWPRAREST
jgi:hypothetical protein